MMLTETFKKMMKNNDQNPVEPMTPDLRSIITSSDLECSQNNTSKDVVSGAVSTVATTDAASDFGESDTEIMTTCTRDESKEDLMTKNDDIVSKRSEPIVRKCEPKFIPKIDGQLLKDASDLSMVVFNENQCKKGRTAALTFEENGQKELVAFCNYSIRQELRSFHINYIAVKSPYRRMGYGRTLVTKVKDLCKKKAKGVPEIDVICLSSLPEAVSFYKACGFRCLDDIHVKGEDLIEGQIYMEHVLRRRRRR